jgi:DNA primase
MTDFQRVKEAINLADYIGRYAPLKRAGTIMQCSCPLPGHHDKSPSFQVKGDQWICRGKCNAYGDIFDFAERYHGWDKQEALEELARYAGITLEPLTPEYKAQADKRERLYALMADLAAHYHNLLFRSENLHALAYLQAQRGFTQETIVSANIGYAADSYRDAIEFLWSKGYSKQEMIDAGVVVKKDDSTFYDRFRNRIVISVRDSRGRVVAFTGRALSSEQDPKYMHNATTDIFHKSSIIHRMPQFDTRRGADAFKTVVIVEGSIDPISAANRGVYNVVSILGKELSDDQTDMLIKTGAERLVFCLDQDESGRKALRKLTEKHLTRLASKGIALYAMFSPHGKDPDDCLREKPELWQGAVDAAKPVVETLINLEIASLSHNPTAIEGSKLAQELLPILKNDNPFVEDENIRMLAGKIGIAFDRLKDWARPQIRMLDKPAPIKHDPSPLPTTEEWVLHGIVVNEADFWLTRANSCLLIASDDPMPYALAPLSELDFSTPILKRLFAICLKSQSAQEMIGASIDSPLEKTYKRIKNLDAIGKEFGLTFSYDVFIDRVYQLRLDRLRKERPTFEAKEPAKARECAMAIGCITLAQEDVMERL